MQQLKSTEMQTGLQTLVSNQAASEVSTLKEEISPFIQGKDTDLPACKDQVYRGH